MCFTHNSTRCIQLTPVAASHYIFCEGGHPDEFLDSLICVGIASYMCRLRKKKPTQMQTGFEPLPGSLCPGDVCLG